MKKALIKDSLKQIKNTYKRFISILLMAFLGVGFFAGMRASSPDMVDTINNYYIENQVYDIQILSTLGLTNEDVEEISKIDSIEKAIGTYEFDGKLEIENKEVITKIMCLEDLNVPVLKQGNMPQNENECVVEENFLNYQNKKIGDTIEVEVENTKNDDGEEIAYIKENHLKIVGVVQSPLYISRDRGTSTLGSGKIDYYIYINKNNINAKDIYTSLYVKVKNSDEYLTSSEKYENYIEETKQKIEEIKDKRQNARYENLVNTAKEKVDDAQKELENQQNEANQKLQDAQNELDKAKQEIKTAENQVTKSRTQANSEFAKAEKQINNADIEITQNENNLKEQEEKIKELEKQKEDLQAQLNTVNLNLDTLEKQNTDIIPEEQKKTLEIEIQKLKQAKQTLESGIAQINKGIQQGKPQLENAKKQIEQAKQELQSKKKQYENTKNATYTQIENAKKEIETSKTKLQEGENELQKNREELETKINDAKQELQEAKDKIQEIEHPTWYILDRNGNSGYNGFIQDTKSVDNIAKIFPIVFFVIATLISLTSMTRMVEEQRTQIGTLKALRIQKNANCK